VTTAARLGVLGGTFDPIHAGHLDAARAARVALGLGEVVFVPARVPPHREAPRASVFHRFAMASLAVAGEPGFRVSDMELRAEGPSFTAHTLARLHARGFAPWQLFFITGADAFAEIATWHDYPRVVDAANWVVVARPGYVHEVLDDHLAALAPRFVDVPAAGPAPPVTGSRPTRIFVVAAATTDVSSTMLRRQFASGAPVEGLVPPLVAGHVRRHGLYASSLPAAGLLHEED
jgi:nicotinate-nucleotide adenylyltransferase